jgi:hypothetical protein
LEYGIHLIGISQFKDLPSFQMIMSDHSRSNFSDNKLIEENPGKYYQDFFIPKGSVIAGGEIMAKTEWG